MFEYFLLPKIFPFGYTLIVGYVPNIIATWVQNAINITTTSGLCMPPIRNTQIDILPNIVHNMHAQGSYINYGGISSVSFRTRTSLTTRTAV